MIPLRGNASVLSFFRRPIWYHPALVSVTGDVAGAVWLSWAAMVQLEKGEDTWWQKGFEECEEELGITPAQQRRVREQLMANGLLQRHPSYLLLRVNLRALAGVLVPQRTPGDGKEETPAPPVVAPKKSSIFRAEDALLPLTLQGADAAFRSAWQAWCKDRRERHKPLTTGATKRQLAFLESVSLRRGLPVAIQALNEAIDKGWLFPYEPRNGPQSAYPGPGLPSSGPPPAVEPPAGNLEGVRRRLIDVAFGDREAEKITEEKLDEVLDAVKKADSIAELDRAGKGLPSWTRGGA